MPKIMFSALTGEEVGLNAGAEPTELASGP
jgi:hypothetical protein